MERPETEKHGGGMGERVCLITGATSGIGKATAMGLANMGASVVMVGRYRGKGEDALAEIKEKSANASMELMLADVSSQQEIRRLADEFKEAYPRLDVLINNAGLFRSKRITTADGLEMSLRSTSWPTSCSPTCYSTYSRPAPPPGSSTSVRGTTATGPSTSMTSRERRGKGAKAYSQSKLATVLFTYELARRLEGTGVTANCLHPGGRIPVRTNFGSRVLGVFGFMVRALRPLMTSPEKGAETSRDLGVLPRGGGLERQVLRQEGRDPLIRCVLR